MPSFAIKSLMFPSGWAARAHVLRRLGHQAEARAVFERAASLTDDSALRAYLLEHAGQ